MMEDMMGPEKRNEKSVSGSNGVKSRAKLLDHGKRRGRRLHGRKTNVWDEKEIESRNHG